MLKDAVCEQTVRFPNANPFHRSRSGARFALLSCVLSTVTQARSRFRPEAWRAQL